MQDFIPRLVAATKMLEKQTRKSYDGNADMCRYTHPDHPDTHCLFGWLKPDEDLDDDVRVEDHFPDTGYADWELRFLQSIHDDHWQPGMTFLEAMNKYSAADTFLLYRDLKEALSA